MRRIKNKLYIKRIDIVNIVVCSVLENVCGLKSLKMLAKRTRLSKGFRGEGHRAMAGEGAGYLVPLKSDLSSH